MQSLSTIAVVSRVSGITVHTNHDAQFRPRDTRGTHPAQMWRHAVLTPRHATLGVKFRGDLCDVVGAADGDYFDVRVDCITCLGVAHGGQS